MANFVFILSFCVCITFTIGEPQCSPFHYHEQLLEKMIEVKHQMGLYAEKMEKWENVINEKLSKLDEKSEQQTRLERRLTTSVEKHLSSVNETLAAAAEFRVNLHKEVLDLQAQAMRPSILFRARQPKDRSPSKGDTIVFQEIVQNEGDGYNKNTGIFTAPVSGTYLFTTQFSLYSEKELSLKIVANGTVITAANFGDSEWGYMSSMTDGVATIRSGDKVKVQITYASSGNVIYPDSTERYWSYFSGVLLHH